MEDLIVKLLGAAVSLLRQTDASLEETQAVLMEAQELVKARLDQQKFTFTVENALPGTSHEEG
jgi:hypothetical protein